MAEMYKTPFFYKFLRVYSNTIYSRWFSSTEVNNEKVIPENTSVIFAPNHQNAFIDAMALLWASPAPIMFLAKAAIFKNPLVAKALNFFKIMPAYRMRDGFSNLKKNEESFEEAVKVLAHNQYFCLMPEGGQDEFRRLRPLVKGMFRIAFAAQKQKPAGESVLIIPTGIDYGHYDHSGYHLVLNFGKPIRVADYYEDFLANEAVTQNRIKDELYNRMKPLMHHIVSTDYYDTIYASSYAYAQEMLESKDWDDNETNRLEVRQRISTQLDQAVVDNNPLLPELKKAVEDWLGNSDKVELYARAFEEPHKADAKLITSILYLIGTSPLALYAFVCNGFPYLLFKGVAYKLAHKTGFEASLLLGFVYLVLPFIYLLYIILYAVYVPQYFADTMMFVVFTVCWLLSLPVSFNFMMRYKWRFEYVKSRIQTIAGKGKAANKVVEILRKIVPSI
ncbi:MAG: 1-acyl-sn-glycerol-3-phosphate acyltransferase [Paludibacteraceae bacterium]|nr:1-acyl-sn-glycerol-3-phosphate acyltransferase [Paludibacteraceae bacterium]